MTHQRIDSTQGSGKTQVKRYKKRLPLKVKLFAYLVVLCVFTISLLWIFQLVFLDDFYYHVTLSSLSGAADSYKSVSDEDLDTYTKGVASEQSVNAFVYTHRGELLATSNENFNSIIGHFSSKMILDFYDSAKQNGGTYIYTVDFSDIAVGLPDKDTVTPPYQNDSEDSSVILPNSPEILPEGSLEQRPWQPDSTPKADNDANSITKRLIYTKIIELSDGSERVIVFDCALTPIGTVTKTIQIQLIIVSIMCLVLCAIIALILSYTVSKPISNINRSAKMLASGKYDVVFEGGGCKEIDELSQTLTYTSEELSKLEIMQNELISNISHDLRTPLTMINGYAEVMRDIPGENTPENVQIIIDETKRLSSLVNNLLEVSRAQKNAKILNTERFSITQLLSDTVMRFETLCKSKGYTFVLDTKEDAVVIADKEKISQVLYNLIGNAVNYTGDDKMVFITQTVAEDIVRIDVFDTGEGIEAEKMPHIWQRYYKVDTYHKRSELGMGLGLSIVKDILDAHNAAFGVNSKLGQGSDFWFKLHTAEKNDID